MAEFFNIMGAAIVACLLLGTIYVYFGVHIVRRGVIFVDLALAQVTAMGTTVAFLAGYPLDGMVAYFYSLAFALLGALLFTWTRSQEGRVPQEAIIGIVYAFSAAAVVLLVDRAPHGAEHIKSLLVGNILWVRWQTIGQILAVALGVGLLHLFFHEKFTLVSFDPDWARKHGISVPFWDFLFYLSLAWVVTSSVQVAGVLLIFSFLIVPGVCGLLVSKNFRTSLLVGWLVATSVSLMGTTLSYALDLPTGATIICTFGIVILGIAGLKRLTVY